MNVKPLPEIGTRLLNWINPSAFLMVVVVEVEVTVTVLMFAVII